MNVLSLFDGMACGMLALLKAGIQVNNYYAYEIDKYAVQTASHNFPNIQELGDVFNADFEQYAGIDYLIGGSPCFTKGHYVLTDKGYKDVSEIQVGDMVLTHKGRYRKVVRTNKREADIVDVRIMGYPVFHTTAEHPFYTLERRKATWNEYKNRKSWRVFSNEPKWTKAIELKPKTHFCGQLIGKSAEINATDIDEELAYILGRYVADGHIRKSKRQGRQNSYQYQVILSIGASKIEQFKKNVTQRHFSCYEHTESVYRVCFSSMKLLNFIEQQGFGKGANNKAIPEFIYNLPRDIQLAFLSGYMDGDGHMGEYQYCASTVSPMLAFGLQRLVTQLYGVNVVVTVCNNDKPHKIGDREIHSNYPLYTIVWKENIKKQSVAHIQDGIVWTQVKNVCKALHSDIVYNIEVDEDNSYTVNNVIVHNCTYWSIAQSPDKRETTASG
ncbi:MAG: DNA cytosine methyltransferase, partial [Clostridia bacterium]|nr:DNA cytosine methyltransferase [Clostridia bacterium]